MLFKEIITVYSENYTKLRNTKFSVSVVKAGGRYSYHSALKGYSLVYLRNEALNYSQEFQKNLKPKLLQRTFGSIHICLITDDTKLVTTFITNKATLYVRV
jgi:hypothetical protein